MRSGHEVTRDDFLRAMQNNYHKMLGEQLIGMVTGRLADVHCVVHGATLTVVLVEETGANPSFVLRDLCCDGVKATAQRAFKPTRGPSAE
jgi:hypothetical protein